MLASFLHHSFVNSSYIYWTFLSLVIKNKISLWEAHSLLVIQKVTPITGQWRVHSLHPGVWGPWQSQRMGGSGESLKVRLFPPGGGGSSCEEWEHLWKWTSFPLLLSGAGPHGTRGCSLKSPHPTVTEHFPSLWFPWNTLLVQWQAAHSSTGFRPLLKCSLLGERPHTSHGRHQLHPSPPLVLLSLSLSYFLHLWQPLGMGLWVKGDVGRG